MLKRKTLTQMYDIVDELYPAKQMLRKYKNEEDTPLGFLIALTTRVKIYCNIQELLRRYKRGDQDYKDLLTRLLKQLKLHRFQIKKLSKTHTTCDHQSVHRFCVSLAALLHVVFSDKTT